MSSKYLLLLFGLLTCIFTNAQKEIRKLPSNINQPSINVYAPYISGDGTTLLYLSDYTDDGHHTMYWATKKTVSTWNNGQEVVRHINNPLLNFRGGYSLSFDGDMLLYTSRKFGVGGFDLWYSYRRGNSWEAPKNFGKPINSTGHEGSPVLSPDSEYLYFMRCETMKEYAGATNCNLYVSKMGPTRWGEPVPLPDNINTGNSQTPRILGDGETLLFSSDKFGGAGGLDIMMTKKISDNKWADPIPFTVANTKDNDSFVSIPAKGRYLYKSIPGIKSNELVMLLIPEELQPASVMRITGKITGQETGQAVNAKLTIFNVDDRDRLWNENVGNKGEFAIVLKEGASYDLSVSHQEPGYMFYSKIYELEEIGARDKQKLNITLDKLQPGVSYPLSILFDDNSAKVKDVSIYELRRLGDLMRKNPELRIEIEVYQNNYKEDTLQSGPDLTEVRLDTINLKTPEILGLGYEYDSLSSQLDLSTESQTTLAVDSINYDVTVTYDSLIIAYDRADTLAWHDKLASGSPKSFKIKRTKIVKVYHNDRTKQQAENIQGYIIGRGVEAGRITLKGYANDAAESEGPSVLVKMKVTKL